MAIVPATSRGYTTVPCHVSPVDHPGQQHRGPNRCERDEEFADRSETVAGADERSASPTVGEASGDDLRQCGEPVRDAFDRGHDCDGCSEDRGDEQRQDAVGSSDAVS